MNTSAETAGVMIEKIIKVKAEDIEFLKSSAQKLIEKILAGDCKNNMLLDLSDIMETTQKILNEEIIPDYIKQSRK